MIDARENARVVEEYTAMIRPEYDQLETMMKVATKTNYQFKQML